MLTQLHEALAAQQPTHGLFVSAFDENKELIFSQGSRAQPADEVLDLVYDHRIQNNTDIRTIVLHIVTDVQPGAADDLTHIDITTTGIGIHDDTGNEGAILPHTQGITSIHEALSALKKQADLHGKAELITFTTTDLNFTTSTS